MVQKFLMLFLKNYPTFNYYGTHFRQEPASNTVCYTVVADCVNTRKVNVYPPPSPPVEKVPT